MATYGSIYEFALTSSNGADILIVISKKFYDGKTTRRPLGRAPILKRENSGRVFGTSLEIYAECAVDGEYAQFYTSSADEFKVEVYKNDIRIWSGFISPELYSEPDIAPPYDVQIIATDGLGELKDYTSMREGITTLREHFNRLLQHTGLSLDFRFASSLEYACDNYIYQPYELCDLSIDLTHDADESCYEELQKLLTFLNAGITQFGDRWLIFRETDFINLAQGQTLQVFGSDGTYDYLNIASFGSSKSCPWWPIGQLSSVIKPAKNSLKLSAPNHYKDNVLTGLWEQFDGAVYDNSEGAYNLPVRGSSVKQSIDFSESIDYRLMLRIKARNVGHGGLDQSLAVQVKMHGDRGYIPGEAEEKDYYLWFPGTSDRGPASYTWTTDVKWITPSLAIPEASDTSSDAQDIEIVLPFYNSNLYDRAIARNIEITVQNPSGWHAIYVYDVALYKYDQFAGYEANVKINNGAREEASDVDLTVTNGHDIPVVGSMFMTGIPLIPGNTNKPIDSWRIHASELREYLSTMALDYSRSMALPRMEYKGILNVPAGGLPVLFLRDNTYYFPQTYSYDLYNDELEVSLISVPAAEVEIGSIQISELTGNRGSSGSTGSGNGAGGGSTGGGFGGGGQIVDTEMSDNSSNVVANNVIKAYVDDQIATVVSRIVEAEVITKKFGYDDDGLFTEENFRSYKQIAVGEVGSPDGGGSSGSGVMLLESWSDVPSDLSGYALSAALGIDLHERFNNFYTISDVDNRFSGINSRLATLDSGMADRYTKAESDGRYLKLSGGTIYGTTNTPVTINTSATSEVGLRLSMDGNAKAWVGYTPSIGAYLYNYGTGNGITHRLGLSDSGVGFLDSYSLIHSGNIGSQSVAALNMQTSIEDTRGIFSVYRGSTDADGGDGYIMDFNWNSGNYKSQLYIDVDPTHKMALRHRGKDSVWTAWRTIAFTDSNVASATKLATARTIWGQSFDGTKDIEGDIKNVTLIRFKDSGIYGIYRGVNYSDNLTANDLAYVSIKHAFYTSGYQRLFINQYGNVTIGADDLAGTDTKLYVNGTGRFTDLLTASAGISTPHITIGGITISVVDGVLRIDGNVYTTGQLGVGAVGQEGGGTGGGGVLLLNTWPTDGGSYAGYALGGNLGIDLNTRVKTLEGKATAVSFSQTLTSGKQIGVLTIDGSSEPLYAPSTYAWSEITSRPSKLSDFTDDVVSGKYLSLSGGTISGVLTVTSNFTAPNVYFKTGSGKELILSPMSWVSYALGYYNGSTWKTFAFTDSTVDKAKSVVDASGNALTLIHSGNIGSYKAGDSDKLGGQAPSYYIGQHRDVSQTLDANTVTQNHITHGSKWSNAPTSDIMSLLDMTYSDDWRTQIIARPYSQHIWARFYYNGTTWSGWKTIAFTDSNVASADYATSAGDADTLDGYSSGRFLLMTGRDYAEMDLNTLGGSQSIFTEIRTSEVTTTNSPYSGYGALLSLKDRSGIAKMQFLGSYNSSVLYFRSQQKTGADITSDWKQIAFTDSNVASATKLQTARTIWGQSFDGTGNVSGHLILNNQSAILSYTTSGTSLELFNISSNNNLSIGYSMASVGSSYLYGNAIYLRYGSSRTTGLILNSSGNVTIGGNDLAGTNRRLFTDGSAAFVIGNQNNITTSDQLDLTKTFTITAANNTSNYGLHVWINTSGCVNLQSSYAGFAANKSTYPIALNPLGDNVLIGTTTDNGVNKLQVSGSIRASFGQFGSILINKGYGNYVGESTIETTTAGAMLYINYYHNGGLNLCQGGGNVGIGTTSPAYRLDVAGSIRTTSSLTIGTIVLTDENGTLKIAGNAYTTGQLGVGEAGQPTSGGGNVILDYDSIVDALGFTPAKQNDLSSLTNRVFALESAGPSSSSSLYGDEITIGSSVGNIYISSEDNVQIDTIMGSVLVNGSEVLTKANTAFTRSYASGTKIGTIKIGGTSTDIYVPTSGSHWNGTFDSDIMEDVIAANKDYVGALNIIGYDGSFMTDLYLGYDGYTTYVTGFSEASDMRLKTVIDAVNLDIRDIAFAPVFNYVFKSRPQGRQMLGSSAQYWQPIAPCAVSENDKGNLAMNYGAVALASVVAVAKKTLTHEEEIANLKLEVQDLKQRLARYELN